MKGTRKYWEYVTAGRHGNLWITKGEHARGKTLRVFVIPKGVECTSNGPMNPPISERGQVVEVFGVISGNPGWTEEYGWLHKGKWVDDFEKLVESGRMERQHKAMANLAQSEEEAKKELEYKKAVLSEYYSAEADK